MPKPPPRPDSGFGDDEALVAQTIRRNRFVAASRLMVRCEYVQSPFAIKHALDYRVLV
jgi:hypothetical protein